MWYQLCGIYVVLAVSEVLPTMCQVLNNIDNEDGVILSFNNLMIIKEIQEQMIIIR
jgi:hypothetical protein